MGILVLVLLGAMAFLRYRQLNRRLAAHSAISRAEGYGRSSTSNRYDEEGGVDEEPFELPRDYAGPDGMGYGLSTISLGDGATGGYRDPYAESRSNLMAEDVHRKADAVYDDLEQAHDRR